jgi:pyruvate formate lyase activating enzyme
VTTTRGVVFDIREFTIHDGPGIRTTVFLKGCALSCTWCHNPEGIDPRPEVMRSPAGDRLVGRTYEARELAELLRRQADILAAAEGGVTFSGGEPLMQAGFVAATIDLLPGVHVVLDTSGYGSERSFDALARRSDLVYFDLKLIDPAEHRRWTGQDNGRILRNLARLRALGTPFVARIPMVPGVTDTPHNLAAIADVLKVHTSLVRVDLLPYSRLAGAKYAPLGRQFRPGFDEKVDPRMDVTPFRQAGLEVRSA